jgi:hypothetical protein
VEGGAYTSPFSSGNHVSHRGLLALGDMHADGRVEVDEESRSCRCATPRRAASGKVHAYTFHERTNKRMALGLNGSSTKRRKKRF